MKWFTRIATVTLISAACAGGNELPPEVRNALKPTNVLRITGMNLSDIWRLRPGSEDHVAPDYIILDVGADALSSEMVSVLQSYLTNGGGILFSSHNGCANRILPPSFHIQERRFTWAPYLCEIATPSHPIAAGVGAVRMDSCHHFRLIGRPSAIPLLSAPQWDNETPAYAAVAFEVQAGRAVVIAGGFGGGFPLIKPERHHLNFYDNNRFAHNLDQWLAGLAVPGAVSVVSSASAPSSQTMRDTVILRNGDVISGTIISKELKVQTSYASLSFAIPDIAQVIIEGGGRNVDSLQLHSGDRLSGMIQTATIIIELPTGGKVELEKDKIKEIRIVKRKSE